MSPKTPLHLLTSILSLGTLCEVAGGSDFRVRPDTMLSVDAVEPNHHGGLYQLVQYDLDGNILDFLALNDPVGLDIPSGVVVLGGDVFVCGPRKRMVAQVDLATGTLHHAFVADSAGIEALSRSGNEILVGSATGRIERRDREGRLLGDISLPGAITLTGLDCHQGKLYAGSYADGDIHVFDTMGNPQTVIPTGIGPASVSGLSYDGRSDTLWVTTGFGTDELRQYDLAGNLLLTLPVGLPFLNGLDVVDDELILNAEPNFAIGGIPLAFTLSEGLPAAPFAHFISSVDGIPFFLRVRSDTFPASGLATWDAIVPPGLAPLVIGHTAFAMDGLGKVLASNEELVFHH